MNSPKLAAGQLLSRRKDQTGADQVTLICARITLDDIADYVDSENYFSAVDLARGWGKHIDDVMRQGMLNREALANCRPIHELNAVLHRSRRRILERSAIRNEWRFKWDGEGFVVTDEDGGIILKVDPKDNWEFGPVSGPDHLAYDSGLLSLLAIFDGQTLTQKAESLSGWLDDREARS